MAIGSAPSRGPGYRKIALILPQVVFVTGVMVLGVPRSASIGTMRWSITEAARDESLRRGGRIATAGSEALLVSKVQEADPHPLVRDHAALPLGCDPPENESSSDRDGVGYLTTQIRTAGPPSDARARKRPLATGRPEASRPSHTAAEEEGERGTVVT